MKDADILEYVYNNLAKFIEEWATRGKDTDLLQSRIATMLDNVEDEYKEMASNALKDVEDAVFESLELNQ